MTVPQPTEILPALHFTADGPGGTTVTYRVDTEAPISLRDRELLKALMNTAYKLLSATEGQALAAHRSQP
ncbi:hypothetical protein ACWGIU_17970 [Streptomyces sp. NPDC054840]